MRNNKLFKYVLFILPIVIISFVIIYNSLSATTSSTIWDGTSISFNFSFGNGSEKNPYVISDPSELAYFGQLLEGPDAYLYNNKKYLIGNDLDFGGFALKINNDLPFTGTIDGQGYTLHNLSNDGSIFNKLENATIKNIAFDKLELSDGALIANTSKNNTFSNIIVQGTVDTENDVYGFVNNDNNSSISNVLIDYSWTANGKNSVSFINTFESTRLSNVYIVKNSLNTTNSAGTLSVNTINSVSDLNTTELNNLSSTYVRVSLDNDGNLKINRIVTSSSNNHDDPNAHISGTSDGVVYVNDYVSDYDYYVGLNYTEITDRNVLPGTVNRNVYNDNSLVKVQITYDGHDINRSDLVGKVSPTESESKFVYYKYYPLAMDSSGKLLTENGKYYFDIELIDNPFSNRPKDTKNYYGFNGWVCNNEGSTSGICSNVKFTYDKTIYVRNLRVYVSNNSPVVINLNASWTTALYSTDSGMLTTTGDHFNTMSMQPAKFIKSITQAEEVSYDCNPYFINDTVAFEYVGYTNTVYTNQYTASTRNPTSLARVRRDAINGRTYYYVFRRVTINSGTDYDSSVNYWISDCGTNSNNCDKKDVNDYIAYRTCKRTEDIVSDQTVSIFNDGDSTEGYYYYIGTSGYDSNGLYYDKNGTRCGQTGNTCSSGAYKLIQHNDSLRNADGTSIAVGHTTMTSTDNPIYNYEIYNSNNYYYLATRDTNILVVNTGTTNNIDTYESTYPYTLSGSAYGTAISTSSYIRNTYTSGFFNRTTNLTFSAGNDMVIENIRIQGTTRYVTDYSSVGNTPFYGNTHNIKIGRNITQTETNAFSFSSVIGCGSGNTINSSRYRMIVESGRYSFGKPNVNGAYSTYTFTGMQNVMIFGSDYDRVKNENTKLNVGYGIGVYSSSKHADSSSTVTTLTPGNLYIVKSGVYGSHTSYGNNDSNYYLMGSYLGSTGSPGSTALHEIIIEGGNMFTISGSVGYQTNMTQIAVAIYMKGGVVATIASGAGISSTYGNRLISVTGGQITNAIAGGSNGGFSDSNSNSGSARFETLVYAGGHAKFGVDPGDFDDNNDPRGWYRHTWYRVEKQGSIFGAGLGSSNNDSGKTNSTHVIIDQNVSIYGDVYGGGNYGSAGSFNESSSTIKSTVDVFGGTIKGSLYGGANYNGFGKSNDSNNKVIINIKGGTIDSVYGGSNGAALTGNNSATVYGNVEINVYKGEIGNIYGGGFGERTYVNGSINILGDPETATDVKVNMLYGGSSLGKVNGTSSNSNYKTDVTLNGGIYGDVFGGGEGNSSVTPQNYGDITVNIDGANVSNVFGGNNLSGVPSRSVVVNMKDGEVGNIYGGANQSDLTTSNVNVTGGITTNVYGGSNQSGTVTNSNITLNGGKVGNVYGGNNIDGVTKNTLINENSTIIESAIYGGGNIASTEKSVVNINNSPSTNDIPFVYGGGKSASVTYVTVNMKNGKVDYLFGGSNIKGVVSNSNINYINGTTTNVFGGNNKGGETIYQKLIINNGTITNAYGGGNETDSVSADIIVNNGTITNLYGGGNSAGYSIVEDNDASGTVNVSLNGGTITNVFGGSNTTGDVENANINICGKSDNIGNFVTVELNPQSIYNWLDNKYTNAIQLDVTVRNNGNFAVDLWDVSINIPDTHLVSNYNSANYSSTVVSETNGIYTFNSVNKYSNYNTLAVNGTYTFTIYIVTNNDFSSITYSPVATYTKPAGAVIDNSKISVENLYGGNNLGGKTKNAIINSICGTVNNIYGGGNRADVSNVVITIDGGSITNIYGGGNFAAIDNNTDVDINGGTINGSVFGGGNNGVVNGNTNVTISDVSIRKSVYAGGNGAAATVKGNASINIDGNTVIGYPGCSIPSEGSVFGGGNAASTGVEELHSSSSIVNIVGGTFYGNIYGGANTSVVYGTTEINIGQNIVNNSNLVKSDIVINGTIFGGGEANAAGSEDYDFKFISVTDAINVNIDAKDYNVFTINGSIFGSGNASSTSGISKVNIYNYGTRKNPKRNISIQRTDDLRIDNSSILLKGTTDSTNDYSKYVYSLSRIKDLILINDSTLYLETNANLLEKFESLNSDLSKATVVIDEETGNITSRSSDNRLYVLEGINLNIATNQAADSYGEVNGMTFFGMYNYKADNSISFGIYNPSFNNGDRLNWADMPTKGSYVLGLHKTNHNLREDGYYSNFINDETSTNKVNYILPPDSGDYYMWAIGEAVIEYTVDLVASKYSTLGTYELQFLEFTEPNTSFQLLGFSSENLVNGINLVDKNNIPRVASSLANANSIFGLEIESSNSGWLVNGSSSFISATDTIQGTKYYQGDNSNTVPSLLFYLFHSKNVSISQELGSVTISVQSLRKTDAINFETKRIIINVNMSTDIYQKDEYEGAITPGEKYELFAPTSTNVTSKSKISAYFSIYSTKNIYKTGYYHTLLSTVALPKGTKITMIDLIDNKYYYHIIDQAEYNEKVIEASAIGSDGATYNLNTFKYMGSTTSTSFYDDATKNALYYDGEGSNEEYVFILDFSEAEMTNNITNETLLFELRNDLDHTIISVLAAELDYLKFNVYNNKDALINVNAQIEDETLYVGYDSIITLNTNYEYQKVGSTLVYDTQFFESKLGVEIYFEDSNGNVVTGSNLMGVYFELGDEKFYPNIEGYTKIKISDRVGSVTSWLNLNLSNAYIASGDYKVHIVSFGSPDGVYYGDVTNIGSTSFDLEIINTLYGIDVDFADESIVIDHETGENIYGDKLITFDVKYTSPLNLPRINVVMNRRLYNEEYSTKYEAVNITDYISNQLSPVVGQPNTYRLITNPDALNIIRLGTKENLQTGTYRLDFKLYDDSVFIGEVSRYIIIR